MASKLPWLDEWFTCRVVKHIVLLFPTYGAGNIPQSNIWEETSIQGNTNNIDMHDRIGMKLQTGMMQANACTPAANVWDVLT